MHQAALDWVARWAPSGPRSVLDVGGRDVNGSPAHLFHPQSRWEVVDLHQGPRVTWVGDFADYPTGVTFDAACHHEVAEHTPDWPQHLARIADLLQSDGAVLIFTAAGPARAPHSAIDGGPLRGDEHYENVSVAALSAVLDDLFPAAVVDLTPDECDVRAVAWR